MNRIHSTAVRHGPDRERAASARANGNAVRGAASRRRLSLTEKPMIYAVQSAMLLFGSMSAPCVLADTIVSSGTSTGEIYVPIGTTTNIQVDSGGTVSDSTAIGLYFSTVGLLTNQGVISGPDAIYNVGGTINTLNNGNQIQSTQYGIENATGGRISTLNNGGTISGGVYGIINDDGTIDTLVNSGTIQSTGGYAGVRNDSTINTLTNRGTLSGGSEGVYNWGGSIGTLNNSGTISGGSNGIYNNAISTYAATFGTIENSGLIASSSGIGINNDGAISAITLIDNTSTGTIRGPSYAIYNNGASIGHIANSGLIAGDIANASSNPLSISGSTTAGSFGTLTGYDTATGAIGTITNTLSNLTFSGGNTLLNDNVNVGSYTVTNSGNLAVSKLITIDGNYVQTSSGTLTSNVSGTVAAEGNFSGDTGYGRLRVTGTATFERGASVTLASPSYAFASGQRFVVIEGNTSSSYDTTAGNYTASGYSGTVSAAQQSDGANQALVLSLSDAPSSNHTVAPTTQIAGATLGGLLRYSGIQAGLLDLYDASLAIGSTEQANHVGAELAPTQNFGAGEATSMATFDALNVVSMHLDTMRLASSASTSTSFGSGVSTGEDPANRAVWGQLYGGHAHQGMVDAGTYNEVSGYSSNYGGLILGADRSVSDRWQVGGAFAYSNTAVYGSDDATGDSAHVDAYGLIGYASYSGNPWYVNLSASATLQKYRTSRLVSFDGFSGDAEGSFTGSQYVARAEFGYPIALPKTVVVTPIAALTYSGQRQDSYTESGGNGAALSVDSAHTNTWRSSLGAKLETQFATHYGELVPFARLLWTHQYNDGRPSTIASYAADTAGETGFMVMGATPARDLAEIRLGVDLLRSDTTTLALRYDLQAASSYLSQALSVRLRKQF
jgi:outer membrane autotransporter protein